MRSTSTGFGVSRYATHQAWPLSSASGVVVDCLASLGCTCVVISGQHGRHVQREESRERCVEDFNPDEPKYKPSFRSIFTCTIPSLPEVWWSKLLAERPLPLAEARQVPLQGRISRVLSRILNRSLRATAPSLDHVATALPTNIRVVFLVGPGKEYEPL